MWWAQIGIDLAINVPFALLVGWWGTSRYVRKAHRKADREHRAHMMTIRVEDPTGTPIIDIDCDQLALIHRYGGAGHDRVAWFCLENLGGFRVLTRPTNPS